MPECPSGPFLSTCYFKSGLLIRGSRGSGHQAVRGRTAPPTGQQSITGDLQTSHPSHHIRSQFRAFSHPAVAGFGLQEETRQEKHETMAGLQIKAEGKSNQHPSGFDLAVASSIWNGRTTELSLF